MKNKLICLSLLLILFYKVSIYLSKDFENKGKEEKRPVVTNSVLNNKNGTEYIKELEGFGATITRLVKEKGEWRVYFEVMGSKNKISDFIKMIEKYEIVTYNLSVYEAEVKLIAELYCK